MKKIIISALAIMAAAQLQGQTLEKCNGSTNLKAGKSKKTASL